MNTDLEHREQQTKQSRWGFRGMTVRDWLPIVGALLIPVVIAAGTWGITWQQGKIEGQRAQAERKLAEQRAQDEALQAYLNQMGTLLLEKDLRNAQQDSEVRILARARTLTVLERLDPSRKTTVMQFLSEASLVTSSISDISEKAMSGSIKLNEVFKKAPVISLSGADLSGTDLSNLGGGTCQLLANFRGVYYFCGGGLKGGSNLNGADLSSADLSGANLRDAFLQDANLENTNLSNANLRGAFLQDANLEDTNLIAADLSGAAGISNKVLGQHGSLEGATMPNGQKYEDWLKSKGRGEDGENNGPSQRRSQ
jgi:uncharacterized protein YjbI with pentapeptide repeats